MSLQAAEPLMQIVVAKEGTAHDVRRLPVQFGTVEGVGRVVRTSQPIVSALRLASARTGVVTQQNVTRQIVAQARLRIHSVYCSQMAR